MQKFAIHNYVSSRNRHYVNFTNDKKVIHFFKKNYVSFGFEENHTPNVVSFSKSAEFESYSMLGISGEVYSSGAFSYSNSQMRLPGIEVGRYCSIAKDFDVLGERHPYEWVSHSSFFYNFNYTIFRAAHNSLLAGPHFIPPPEDVAESMPVIGHDVWIGQNVRLARGIKLGTGCVVAAGSIVTKDVPPYAIVGGVPAKIIKYRFSGSVIERLLSLEWWKYSPRHVFDFNIKNPEEFIKNFESAKEKNELEFLYLRKFSLIDIYEHLLDHNINIKSRYILNRYNNIKNNIPEGWSAPEAKHTWMIGHKSIFRVPDFEAHSPVYAKLSLWPAIFRDRGQRLMISSQGRQLYEGVITTRTDVEFEIPPQLGTLELVLEHPDAQSPASACGSNDNRLLSLAVEELWLVGGS